MNVASARVRRLAAALAILLDAASGATLPPEQAFDDLDAPVARVEVRALPTGLILRGSF